MKKLWIAISVCILTMASTLLLGFSFLGGVQAQTSPTAVSGMDVIGAGLRLNPNGEVDSQTGLRFATTVTDEALDEIFSGVDDDVQVVFGTEIIDQDTTTPGAIADISYVSATKATRSTLDKHRNEDGVVQYYAAITFYDDEFDADVEAKVQSKLEGEPYNLNKGTEEYAALLNKYIEAYRRVAYAELLEAKSYYKIGDVKYYTPSVVRSMRMVANYCDKIPEAKEFLTEEFYNKNYFVNRKTS